MPVFRVQVNYIKGINQKWSNVWHVVAADILTAADSFVINSVPDLLPILNPACTLVSVLTSDPLTTAFTVNTLNLAGTSTIGSAMLALFNCVRVIIPVAGFGRPDIKYMKGWLTEDSVSGDNINPDAVTVFTTHMDTMFSDAIASDAPLCSETGETYATAVVQPAVQMRQMHRKRKKSVPALLAG